MITITIYGLDQFVVGNLSRELTPLVAKLYEVSEDDVIFLAPQTMVFHKGTEQTSWNILIHVNAPKKVSVLQDQMSELMLHGIGDVAINVAVEFYYYSQDDRYEKINESYPRWLSDENLVSIDDEYPEDLEEGEEEDQIYTGDIFEGIK
ncbi:MAG: hypothetical protein IJK27_05025 [Bacilli bacterium]|nr:hypothetical protein [Bacilli bacterium]